MLSERATSRHGCKRIAVIGAGAVGIGCAIHLKRAGHEVEVFDPREPGFGASFGNSGIIAISEVLPLGRPAILRQLPKMLMDQMGPLVVRWRYLPQVAPWLVNLAFNARPSKVQQISRALGAMLGAATSEWSDIVRGTNAKSRIRDTGWMRMFSTPEQVRNARNDAERQRELGVDMRILTPGEAHELEPAIAPVFAGASFSPGAWSVDTPQAVLATLAEHLSQSQVGFIKREIKTIDTTERGVTLRTGDDESLAFDKVVIACGAWSGRLLQRMGVHVMLDTERGYHVMLNTPTRTLTRPVTISSPGYTLAQMQNGLRLSTGVEFAGLDAPPDYGRIRKMAAHAATIIDGLDPRANSEWLGFRPSMPNSLPLIGPLQNRPNVLLAFGHGHLGLTLGPLTGRIIAAMVDGSAPPLDVSPFLPRI
jgi:D-amino-acid dehydrogenase